MTPHEAFRVMGLSPDVSPEGVREAYRDLVKVWHPDRFRQDPQMAAKADAKLKEINEAYRILKDRPQPASFRPRSTPSASPGRPYAERPASGDPQQTPRGSFFIREGRTISWFALLFGLIIFGLAWFIQASRAPQPSNDDDSLQDLA